jgi:hypothetical protein
VAPEQAALWKVPAAQLEQVAHCPPLRKVPLAQLAQSVAAGPEQVAQDAAHDAHTVSVVAVHAVDAYSVVEQAVHEVHAPPERNLPVAQVAHSVVAPPVQVVQVGEHAAQSVSVSGVHTPFVYWPAGHVEHVLQTPFSRYLPAAQLVHAEGPAPVHVVQLASHPVQTRSVGPPQAVLSYCPDGQAPEQTTQAPPFR